jgi:prepilin-type processing-associated H-X9-DG protein
MAFDSTTNTYISANGSANVIGTAVVTDTSTTTETGISFIGDYTGATNDTATSITTGSGDPDFCHANHPWSFHSGGANMLLGDGSVRFVTYSASRILPAMATIRGGEIVELPD